MCKEKESPQQTQACKYQVWEAYRDGEWICTMNVLDEYSHTGAKNPFGTMLNAVKHHCAELKPKLTLAEVDALDYQYIITVEHERLLYTNRELFTPEALRGALINAIIIRLENIIRMMNNDTRAICEG